ncbi:MAG TPA: hypothetical protein VFP50_09910 [Anaeromyxobacteraceae bacterium]|nr:hypothetical protein [Anaeromyxobacteraceae bacterium]
MTRITVLAAALAAALAGAGCGRAHLNPAQGVSYRKAFAAQQVTPSPQWRAPTPGLDTQEADVVAKSYVRSLAGKAREEAPEPVLYVAPPMRGAGSQPLAPSVPRS